MCPLNSLRQPLLTLILLVPEIADLIPYHRPREARDLLA
jgi:hypothetical protein